MWMRREGRRGKKEVRRRGAGEWQRRAGGGRKVSGDQVDVDVRVWRSRGRAGRRSAYYYTREIETVNEVVGASGMPMRKWRTRFGRKLYGQLSGYTGTR